MKCTRCHKKPKMHPLSPYCRTCRAEVHIENRDRWLVKAKTKNKPRKYTATPYERHHHMRLLWFERPSQMPNEKNVTKQVESAFQVLV